MPRETFNYSEENLCGGATRSKTSLGPRPQPKSEVKRNDQVQRMVYAAYVASLSKVVNTGTAGATATRVMPESELLERSVPKVGEAITKKTGTMGAATYIRNLKWLKAQPPAQPEAKLETQDEWLRRHRLGPYAPTLEVAWTTDQKR